MKKLLWLSLGLLLTAYSVLGYLSPRWTVSSFIWLCIPIITLGQILVLSQLPKRIQDAINTWFGSGLGRFLVAAGVSLGLVVALVWFHFFQYVLMIGAAEILARVELRHVGFSRIKSLGTLMTISLTGLMVGWLASPWS